MTETVIGGVTSRYAMEGGQKGKLRLNVLAEVMRPYASALLDAAGVPAGARCVDVGCGGGHVALELAARVGPLGHVVGIDVDAEILALARADAVVEGVANIEYREGDAHQLQGQYDVVYARFLLSHLHDPRGVVTAMASVLAPGGVVVIEDVDFTGSFCHPDNRGYRRYLELYRETIHRRGGNADIGPSLPGLLRDAGLRDIGVRVVQPVALHGEGKLVSYLTLERITQALLAERVTTEDELAEVRSDLLAFTNDPTTVISLPRMVQASGRGG